MKKIIILAIVGIMALPSLTFASTWWKPWTWNDTPIQIISSETISPTLPSGTSSEPQIKEVIEEVPDEKVVTKTVTVQDPALQKQIDTLIKENTDLKAQINKLIDEGTSYKSAMDNSGNLLAENKELKYQLSLSAIDLKIAQTRTGERNQELHFPSPNTSNNKFHVIQTEIKRLQDERAKLVAVHDNQ